MNVFQFKHVGEGLFYMGSINNDINFVYDCGTADSTNALISEITNGIAGSNKNIDFIIISNLKKEFINGLPYLCANYKVKKIYLPYLGSNTELIRFILFITIFKNAELDREDLKLYSFMCQLYDVKTYIYKKYEGAIPKVVFLGDPDVPVTEICRYDGKVISHYENIADNTVWKFIVINKLENLNNAVKNFIAEFKQIFCSANFTKNKFERYLFEQSSTNLKELQTKAEEIFRVEGGICGLSENILIHYPPLPFYNIYLFEYKNIFDNSTATEMQPIQGAITLLLGDSQVDKTLKDRIFSTGNYSLCAGLFQIPYKCIAGQNPNVMILANAFDNFVISVNTETAKNILDTNKAKYLRAYKRIHVSSLHTGIAYLIQPAKRFVYK